MLHFNIFDDSFILITDNGGVALEYFLIQKKPVLFVNYVDKIHNIFYNEIKIETVEDKFKKKFGLEIEISHLKNINLKIEEAVLKFEKNKNIISNFASNNGIILEDQTINAERTIINLLEEN